MNMGMVGIRGGDVVVVAPASSFHHHHHHHHNDHHQINHDPISNSNTALGVGVIPLLTTAPCLPTMGIEDGDNNRNRNSGAAGGGGIQFWQNTQQSYLKKPTSMFDHTATSMNFLTGGVGVGVGGGDGATGGGVVVQTAAMTCQDCGNQAKKDCTHRRCRTCCKSRGFDCATHVKSTWVPAARRRERQLCTTTTAAAAGSSGSSSAVKRPKLSQTTNSHTSTSNTTPPRSLDTSSSHQDASFKETLPRQVRAPAVFKCVRVTAIDDGEDEYAYQAVVKIGGHVFKGFLYDQGIEGREGFPNISDLHLGGGGNGGVNVNGRNGASSSSPVIDPSDVYAAASGGGLLGGAAAPPYGNPIN